jgi:uncharacterized protein (TIRG00374 family)
MKIKSILKFLLYWVIILFFGWVMYQNIGDFTVLLSTIKNADYVLLGWAVLLSIGNLAIMTIIFRANFAIFHQEINLGSLLPEIIAFSFTNISNPLGTTGATTLMIKRLVSKGHSYLKSIFAFFATQLSVNLVFLVILGFSFVYLRANNELSQYENLAAKLLVLVNAVYVTAIFFILVLPKFSIKVSRALSNIANYIAKKIFKRSVINPEKLGSSIDEIQKASGRFDKSVLKFIRTLIPSLFFHIINIGILYISFYMYGNVYDWSILLSLYSMIFLFSIVSPTPQGIGIVEGLAQIGAISLGIPPEIALVGILTYRAIVVWFPALVGLLVFRKQGKADSNR